MEMDSGTARAISGMGSPPAVLCLTVFYIASQVCVAADAENNDVYLPKLQLKTLTPQPPSATPLPVSEKDLWGLRLWQIVGLFFAGAMLLAVFCCCLCDCRIPKTQYDQQQGGTEENSDSESNCDRAMPSTDRVMPNEERMIAKSGWARIKRVVEEQAREVRETDEPKSNDGMPSIDRVMPNDKRMVAKSGWARIKRVVEEAKETDEAKSDQVMPSTDRVRTNAMPSTDRVRTNEMPSTDRMGSNSSKMDGKAQKIKETPMLSFENRGATSDEVENSEISVVNGRTA